MSEFTDGFCLTLGGTFTDDQVREIRTKLDIYTMKFMISPVTAEIVAAEYQLPQALKLYLATKKQDGRMSKRSYEQYYSCLSKMLYDLRLPLNQITVNHLRLHIEHISTDKRTGKPLSPATMDQRKCIIRSFFQWLYAEEYVDRDPSVRIKPVRKQTKPREAYRDVQVEQLRDACNTERDRAMLDVLSSSGIRIAECVGLNRRDIDLEKREAVVYGKGGKYRTVYIDARAVVSLERYLASRDDDHEALFVSLRKPHDRITTFAARRVLHIIGDKSNVENVIPHRFRHTTATKAINNGMPVESVQAILGHSQIATTMRYAHLSKDKVKRDHEMYMH